MIDSQCQSQPKDQAKAVVYAKSGAGARRLIFFFLSYLLLRVVRCVLGLHIGDFRESERERFVRLCLIKMNGVDAYGVMEAQYIRRHHRHEPRENQCTSALVKHIRAPVHLVNKLSVYFRSILSVSFTGLTDTV